MIIKHLNFVLKSKKYLRANKNVNLLVRINRLVKKSLPIHKSPTQMTVLSCALQKN